MHEGLTISPAIPIGHFESWFFDVIATCCTPELNVTNFQKNICNNIEKKCDYWNGGSVNLADKCCCMFWIFKCYTNITVGASKILRKWFLRSTKFVFYDKKLPARPGRQVKKVTCPGQNFPAPGRRLFSTLFKTVFYYLNPNFCFVGF